MKTDKYITINDRSYLIYRNEYDDLNGIFRDLERFLSRKTEIDGRVRI